MPYYNNRFSSGCSNRVQPRQENTCNTPNRPQCPVPLPADESGEWCQDIFVNARGPLAMGGVVWQKSNSPEYDLSTALIKGTIYKELDKPFLGKGGCRR
ncbi:MAG: spore coat associated protein CotJA [Lachnospiraceae bacterium]|nr:spore coat associated protein CotJA [Lachnospiraceae bacterium]